MAANLGRQENYLPPDLQEWYLTFINLVGNGTDCSDAMTDCLTIRMTEVPASQAARCENATLQLENCNRTLGGLCKYGTCDQKVANDDASYECTCKQGFSGELCDMKEQAKKRGGGMGGRPSLLLATAGQPRSTATFSFETSAKAPTADPFNAYDEYGLCKDEEDGCKESNKKMIWDHMRAFNVTYV